MRRPPPVTVQATLQDHRVQRESWAVATVLIRQAEGEIPFGLSEGCEVSAVGDRLGMAAPGERLELRGSWENTKFGLQLRVQEQVSQGVKAPREAARWLERLDGVGPVLARALMDHFGARIVPILSGELEADLTEVRGVSEAKAAHILESFAELALAGDLESVRFLDSVGASRYEATKILQWCKRQRRKPKDVLEGSPYDLMQVKGLGFARVDRLAQKAGCPPHAPARIQAAAMHQLNVIVDRGSTMSLLFGGRFGGLVGETAELLGVDKDLAMQGVKSLAANGSVILAEDDKGRQNAHPKWLLDAEREIYRAAKGIGFADSGGPLKAAEDESKGDGWDDLADQFGEAIKAVAPSTETPKEQGGGPSSPVPAPLTPAAGSPPPTPAAGGGSSCWCAVPCDGDCGGDPLRELRVLGAKKRAAARVAEDSSRNAKPASRREKVTHVWE